MNVYCTYRHRRLDTNEVFYIGIGNLKRPYAKYKSNRNKYWHNIVNKVGYSVEIISYNLDWETACELEIFLISLYGRKDLNTGTLCNMTSGGDGTPGTYISEEMRLKLSKARKGSRLTKEHIEKIIISNKGRKTSEITKNKISNSNKLSRKKIKIGSVKKRKIINIITLIIYSSIRECCRFENINYSTLQRQLTGKSKTENNFKYLEDGNK